MTARELGCGALVLLALVATGCRDATYVSLELETDVKCVDLTGTNITVGRPTEVESLSATTTTKRCESDGEIGTLVLVPSDAKDERFSLRVVAGVGKTPDACEASGFTGGCIVARRSLRFVPHTALTLPVALTLDCLDVPCGELETCVHGQCLPSLISNPSSCAAPGGCVLGAGGSGGSGGAGGTSGGTGGTGSGGTGGVGGSGGTGGNGGTGGSTTGGTGGIASGGTGGIASGGTGGIASGGTGGASCAPPTADCDGSPTSCETNLDTTAAHCGACGHGCLGGACVAAKCQPVVVASGGGAPRFVAVDGVDVYWSTYAANGAIRKAPLDGSKGPSDVSTNQPFVATLVLDALNVYWTTNENAGAVLRLPKIGGPPTLLAGAAKPNGLAVDATTAFFSESGGTGELASAPLAGGGPKTTLVSNQAFPWGVALDATHLYYVANTANGGVLRALKGGGAAQQLATAKFPYAVAVDASSVFFVDVTGAYQVPNGGGTPSKLGSANDSYALAIDSTHVYWTDYGGGLVLRAPKGGGPVTTLAAGQAAPWGIGVDGTAVYWANATSGGAVMRVAKPLP